MAGTLAENTTFRITRATNSRRVVRARFPPYTSRRRPWLCRSSARAGWMAANTTPTPAIRASRSWTTHRMSFGSARSIAWTSASFHRMKKTTATPTSTTPSIPPTTRTNPRA